MQRARVRLWHEPRALRWAPPTDEPPQSFMFVTQIELFPRALGLVRGATLREVGRTEEEEEAFVPRFPPFKDDEDDEEQLGAWRSRCWRLFSDTRQDLSSLSPFARPKSTRPALLPLLHTIETKPLPNPSPGLTRAAPFFAPSLGFLPSSSPLHSFVVLITDLRMLLDDRADSSFICRFLELDPKSWPGIEETALSSSPVEHHIETVCVVSLLIFHFSLKLGYRIRITVLIIHFLIWNFHYVLKRLIKLGREDWNEGWIRVMYGKKLFYL